MQNICHPAIVSFFLNFICIIDDFLIHCKMHDVVSVKFKWVLIQYTMLNCSPNLFIVILRVQRTSSKKMQATISSSISYSNENARAKAACFIRVLLHFQNKNIVFSFGKWQQNRGEKKMEFCELNEFTVKSSAHTLSHYFKIQW